MIWCLNKNSLVYFWNHFFRSMLGRLGVTIIMYIWTHYRYKLFTSWTNFSRLEIIPMAATICCIPSTTGSPAMVLTITLWSCSWPLERASSAWNDEVFSSIIPSICCCARGSNWCVNIYPKIIINHSINLGKISKKIIILLYIEY